jgi:predicted transcriptional regulator
MIQKLKDLIERVESWPDDAQAELVALALEIEAEQRGLYHASEDELAAIDQGLAEVEKGDGVPEAAAEAIFARARRA